ncbi:MAG: MOSC N-terminal beta barrel domain-containing protein [Deinococcota bacterium]
MDAKLAGLSYYPIKSAAGIHVNEAVLEPRGLRYDRRWLVVDDAGMFITQRTVPKLALLKPVLDGHHLTLQAHHKTPLTLPLTPPTPPTPPLTSPQTSPEHSEHMTVTIWNDTVPARLVSAEADAWLSEFLETPVRLVAMPEESLRPIDPDYAQTDAHNIVSFADGFAVLVISEASLTDLNSRLAEDLPMNRFRPNLVVRGVPAYAEDRWTTMHIGEAILRVVKPCVRCVVTTTNQTTLERGREPLKTLASYRRALGGVIFGQNAVVVKPGKLELGMPITLSG